MIADRLASLRRHLDPAFADAVLLRATDEWLNEYVPKERSHRVALTGFTGSMGDAVITQDRAVLVVDGRYTLQAKSECPGFEVRTVPLGTSIEEGWLSLLGELKAEGVRRLGVPATATTASLHRLIALKAGELALELVPGAERVFESAREELALVPPPLVGTAFSVAPGLVGKTVKERVAEAAPSLKAAGVDAYLAVPLDEVAWLTNLRGDAFPFQATFPARALLTSDRVLLAWTGVELREGSALEEGITTGRDLAGVVEGQGLRVGYDPQTTSEALRSELAALGVVLVEMASPLRALRTHKTRAELEHMASAFARADEVVKKLQTWVNTQVSRGAQVSEADVSAKLTSLFERSGAIGHSFRTIAGVGAHGAIIHYGTPDARTFLKEGDLFLLDCGAYYEAGLATDLTRTFLVGKSHVKATDEQRRLFTLVLKASIAGMSARVPVGTTGEQLDAIVRYPLWQAGLDYGHGTGHGVGVNVHEFPPRIAPRASAPVEPGFVFSIEPGLYLEGKLGIRIENLCTAEVDRENARFLRIRPMTFSPLDKRLIEPSLLTPHEKRFLTWWKDREKLRDGLRAPLPPVV